MRYRFNETGDIIYFEKAPKDPYNVDIKGSGKQLVNFIGMEKGYVASAASMEGGGIGGMVGAAAIKSTLEVPKIPEQVNFKDLSADKLNFVSIFKINMNLTK